MAASIFAAPSLLQFSSSSKFLFSFKYFSPVEIFSCRNKSRSIDIHSHSSLNFKGKNENFICRAKNEYKFPDPIPEFAASETEKFRAHLHEKLSNKDIFGDSVDQVVEICTKIFNDFLHTEYGGPGTLLVDPFMEMADTIGEIDLPGGPQAARAAVKWAQKHVDKDWKEWNNGEN